MKIISDAEGKPQYLHLTEEEYKIYEECIAEQLPVITACGDYDPFGGPLPFWRNT